MVISKLCNQCLGCNRLENPNFLGVEECENCTLNQVISEQMRMEGIYEQISQQTDNSRWNKISKYARGK